MQIHRVARIVEYDKVELYGGRPVHCKSVERTKMDNVLLKMPITHKISIPNL